MSAHHNMNSLAYSFYSISVKRLQLNESSTHACVFVQKSPDVGQMDLIEYLFSEWKEEDNARHRRCNARISRLFMALAVAGVARAQEILSNFIVHHAVFHSPECVTKAIEATHRVENPGNKIFDTVYFFASQLGNPVKHTHNSAVAMLALGSLGRSNREFAGTSQASIDLSAKASYLLHQKFRETLDTNAVIDNLHRRSQIQMAEAFRGASWGKQNHLMASIRSLTR